MTHRNVTLTGDDATSVVSRPLANGRLTSEHRVVDDGVKDRVRQQVGDAVTECPRCKRTELRLMRSRDVRSGAARLNPFWDAHEKTYERCKVCGFRRAVSAETARRVRSEPVASAPRRPVVTALGWATVVLMVVAIAVLTVVLAGMLLVVSVWLAVAVPVVVLLLAIGIAAFARRG